MFSIVAVSVFEAFIVLCCACLFAGKKSINCHKDKVTIKSPFMRQKEISIGKETSFLLRCKGTGKYDSKGLFHARVRMPIYPAYYDIEIGQTGELILTTGNKACALKAFDYICKEFPNNPHKILFNEEKNILQERRQAWSHILKRAYMFMSFLSLFACLILGFVSYGLYADYSNREWKKQNVVVGELPIQNEVIEVQTADTGKNQLQCGILREDVPALQKMQKGGKALEAYISYEKQPQLRIRRPTKKESALFLCYAVCAFLFSCFFYYHSGRVSKKGTQKKG